MKLKTSCILLPLILLLNGCEPPPPHPQIAVLQASVSSGNLAQQQRALQILVKEGEPQEIPYYQQALTTISEVEALNRQAQDTLQNNRFEALEMAIKADKQRFNNDSRQIIKQVLSPYLDFYDLKPRLQQWAFPPLDKVVVAGSMPDPVKNWQQPMTAPQLWPNNGLMALLQSQQDKHKRLWPKIAQERKELVELVRATLILSKKRAGDPMLDGLHQDTLTINAMYNTILTDYQWHFLQKAIKATISANDELLTVAQDAIIDKLTPSQWQIDYQLSTGIHLDKISFCCLYYQDIIATSFANLANPSTYVEAVSEVEKAFKAVFKTNFNPTNTPQQTMALAKRNNQTLAGLLVKVAALSEQIDRKTMANQYLRTIYRWQQGDFHQLGSLLGHIRDYRSAIRL